MMNLRQMSDAVAVRQFKKDGLRLIDAEHRGRFLYIYFLGAAVNDDLPSPKYFLAQSMELDCVTEDDALKNMEYLRQGAPDFSP